MTNDSSQLSGLSSLLKELSQEVDDERRAEMPPEELRMYEIAREVLRLERDMTIPGSSSSESVRVERLMRFIEEREF